MKNKKLAIVILIIFILSPIIFIRLKLNQFNPKSDLGLSSKNDILMSQISNKEVVKSTSSTSAASPNPKSDLINVFNIDTNQLIKSPLSIRGQAKGFWFFEASFPIKIFDSNGQLLGSAIAQANSDWMTDKMIPFSAELKFNTPTTTNGIIIFEKDNPSGLTENSDQLSLPIMFSLNDQKKGIIQP